MITILILSISSLHGISALILALIYKITGKEIPWQIEDYIDGAQDFFGVSTIILFSLAIAAMIIGIIFVCPPHTTLLKAELGVILILISIVITLGRMASDYI